MIKLDGYTLSKCLKSLPDGEVYVATRDADACEVVLKVYTGDSSLDAGSCAQREFDVIRRICSRRVIRPLEVDRSSERPVLVLEKFEGSSLDQLVAREPLTIVDFLAIALQLAEVVAEIHAARVIHKDLKPSNILWNRDTREACLVDLGMAAELGQSERSDALAGTLAYIAPEQTGRMGRGVDHRSDLYSLGATFYHLLVGAAPFETQDPLELVHAHIARLPRPPHERRPDLPPTLSRIVMKLLRKEPDERYQSARALHADLLQCQGHFQRTSRIPDDLTLGTADVPDRPVFRSRLYGRESEIERLRAAYARVSSGGTEVLLVGGAPGLGKSALVAELRQPIVESRGYLAQGKFDRYRSDLPYAGLMTAFHSFAHQLLAGNEEQLRRWREELRARLGGIAQALVQLAPDLGLVLGECPAVPQLGPAEAQQRLGLAVRRFVEGCATKSHPLVLFLDDLQWADAGSRYLLEGVLASPKPEALLVVGTYRDSELAGAHPLAALIEHLEQEATPVQILELAPLGEDASAHMLSEALGRTRAQTLPLARRIALKTGNSPLLIQQFVYHLLDVGLIRFEAGQGWVWDEAEIAAARIPDDAAALMASKLARLEETSLEAIRLASCIGDEFSVATLAEVAEQPGEGLASALFALCETGLIAPCPAGYRFLHDRIREGAQALLSPEERSALHHRVGRLLLERTPEASLSERVFEIADHWNRAGERLSEEERIRLVRLDLLAGGRALASGASVTAKHYFELARALFREADWERHFALGCEVWLQSAEAAYQTLEFDGALALLASLEQRPLPRLLAAQVASKQVAVHAVTRSPEEVLPLVLAALRRFGVNWPEHPSKLRTWIDILRADWALRGPLDDERRFHGAASSSPDWLAPMLVIRAGGSTITRTSIRLACICMSFVLRTYMREGVSTGFGLVLPAYAGDRLGFLRSPRGALRYLEAGLAWKARLSDPLVNPRVDYIAQVWIKGWLEPRRRALEPLRKVQEAAQEIGDLELAAGCALWRKLTALFVGTPLSEALGVLQTGSRMALGRSPAEDQEHWHRAYELLIAATPAAPQEVDAAVARIEELVADHPRSACQLATHWAAALCVLGRFAQAFEQTESLRDVIFEVQSFSTHVADFTFYRGLAAGALADRQRGRAARRCRSALRSSLRQLRRWARYGPDYVHMAQALEAERARLRGLSQVGLSSYGKAAERASAQGYRHHAALLHERRAHLLKALRRDFEAASALRQAMGLYGEWGANAKVASLSDELSRSAR